MKRYLRIFVMTIIAAMTASEMMAAEANTPGYKFSIKSSGATFAFEVIEPCVIEGEDVTYGTIKLYKFTQNEETPLTEIKSSYISRLSLTSGNKYNIVEIGDEVFKDQTAITKVASGPYIKKIGASAFEGCSGVNQFQFDSVEEICDNAFKGCSYAAAKFYFLGSKVPTVGIGAFEGIASDAKIRFSISNVTNDQLEAFSAYSNYLQVYFSFSPTTGYIKLLSCKVPMKLSNPESSLNIYYVKSAKETSDGVEIETGLLQSGEFNIPANTALIYEYHGTATSPVFGRSFYPSEPSVSYENILTATANAEYLPASDGTTNYYVFDPSSPNERDVTHDLTFTKVTTETKIPAGQGYLVMKNGSATGIDNAKVRINLNGKVYNLSGQRVNDNYKGVVIKEGKKIVNK